MESSKLCVGFARVDVTPTDSQPLAGYGNTAKRMSQNILDAICTTCISVTDENDNTVLLYTTDVISLLASFIDKAREEISKATGVPYKNIIFNVTHTHAAPDPYSSLDCAKAFYAHLIIKMVEAANASLADRAPAKLLYAKGETNKLNFIRHYIAEDGIGISTDNHDSRASKDIPLVDYCSKVDPTLQVMKFARDGKKDIVYVSWRAHGTKTGGLKKFDMSADFPHTLRKFIEQDADCHCGYYQGCAGNVNPRSRLDWDKVPDDYNEYGRLLADSVLSIMNELKPVNESEIKINSRVIEYNMNHADEDKLEAAEKVIKFWVESNDPLATREFAKPFGIFSPYHANAIKSRSVSNDTMKAEIDVISFSDDIGLVFLPGEPFAAIGVNIREKSPFKNTIVMGYSAYSVGYIPTVEAFKYGCYEADCTKNAEGTDVLFEDTSIEMLNEIK